MSRILLVPLGTLPDGYPRKLAAFLAAATGRACSVGAALEPDSSYNPDRGQYDCRRILPLLDGIARSEGATVLGVADVDLYSAIFTFVFGEAILGGRCGLFSLHRLHQRYYGLADSPDLLEARARKEALHETGHLLGLVHCPDPECVMRFSGSAEEVDLKTDALCPDCRKRAGGPGG